MFSLAVVERQSINNRVPFNTIGEKEKRKAEEYPVARTRSTFPPARLLFGTKVLS